MYIQNVAVIALIIFEEWQKPPFYVVKLIANLYTRNCSLFGTESSCILLYGKNREVIQIILEFKHQNLNSHGKERVFKTFTFQAV
jgi:hypothetical protein